MPQSSRNRTNRNAQDTEKQGRRNSLGIDEKTLERLIEKLETLEPKTAPVRMFKRRKFARVSVELRVHSTGGSDTTIQVASRNISAGGISLLHNAYQHVKKSVTVSVPTARGTPLIAAGEIVRCSHLGGVLHEIGVEFSPPIDLNMLGLEENKRQNVFSLEHVDSSKLTGVVLLVEDAKADQRLFRHYLRETNVNVVVAETLKDALARADQPIDLLFCDYHLPDSTGAQVVEKLRSVGVHVPVILATSDGSDKTNEAMRAVSPDAVLLKPLSQHAVLIAIGEYLYVRKLREDKPVACESEHVVAADGNLIAMFTEQLGALLGDIRASLDRRDEDDLRRLTWQIRSVGPLMNHHRLASKAEEVLSSPVSEFYDAAQELIEMAESATRRSAA